jgi:hypothetical protein
MANKRQKPEEIVTERRCLMLCCHGNQCLSYSYSLPNKFFQSLVVGMPVIASLGTYLAELVEKHSLGLFFNKAAKSSNFEKWHAAHFSKNGKATSCDFASRSETGA